MADAEPTHTELSLHAELFVIAIDPKTGRLVKRKRRRFRKALRACAGTSRIAPPGSARRAAIRELRAVGFIERSALPGRYPVVSGSGYSKPFGRIRRAIESGDFQDERVTALFALLAWTGVLAQRLDRSDRRTAVKRIKELISPPAARSPELATIPAFALALGQVAFRQEMNIVHEMVSDFLSGDSVSVDLSGSGADGGGFAADGGGGGDGGH